MSVEWEEPPPMEPRGRHEDLFDKLRANPGEWAVFVRDVLHPGGYCHKLVRGKYRGITAGELEVRTHRGSNRRTTIYIRIQGNGQGST